MWKKAKQWVIKEVKGRNTIVEAVHQNSSLTFEDTTQTESVEISSDL